jgi:hypothetical protein
MTKLIEFILSGCWHKWQKQSEATVWEDQKTRPIGYAYICFCERCGEPKRFNLY